MVSVDVKHHVYFLTVASPDSTPRAGAADENKPRDRSPSDRTAAKTRQQQGTSPDRNRRSGDQQRSKPDVSFHATSRDKENVKPENSTQKKEPSPTPASVKSTQPAKKKSREEKGKHTIRYGAFKGQACARARTRARVCVCVCV